MPLCNLNFDAAVRGILECRDAEYLGVIFDTAAKKLAECGMKPEYGTAVETVALHVRGPEKGKPKASGEFVGSALLRWIDGVDASKAKEQAAARALLQAVHATLAYRLHKIPAPAKAVVAKPAPAPVATAKK